MERDEVKTILEEVLSHSNADEAEVLFEEERLGLTRFSNNQIEQNIDTHNHTISIRSISKKRVSRVSTNILNKDSLRIMVKTSEDLIKFKPQDRELLPLPGPQVYIKQDNYIPTTAKCGPKERIKILKDVFDRLKGPLVAAGIVSTSVKTISIANTKGLFAYERMTDSALRLTLMTDESSSFCQDLNKDITRLNVERVVDVAIEKAIKGRKPREISPGVYTVILESQAVGDLIILLSHLAFGGLAYVEGRSFLSGRLGSQVFGKNIVLIDDPYHELSVGIPFDFEGIPRQRVILIEDGIARNVVHSRKTAKKANVNPTGHGLPEPNTTGPIPLNPVLLAGNESLNEMISSIDKGILITQFHYTNVIDPMELLITGMTRNGTFMIEKGRIAYPLKNMRFIESLSRVFNEVDALGQDLLRVGGFFSGSAIVPPLKINRFNFSSITTF